jgi:hypothetical protein
MLSFILQEKDIYVQHKKGRHCTSAALTMPSFENIFLQGIPAAR